MGAALTSVSKGESTHPLHGVRLGQMQRWLLLNAPTPDAVMGFALDQENPTTREQLRRAACRLEEVGLLERERMQVYVRARDPRRQGLVLRDGAFFKRTDPTRAHAARRNVIWLSPFGSEIVDRYRSQIRSGSPIRWDARTVERARKAAARRWPVPSRRQARGAHIAGREDEERDSVVLADARQGFTRVVPEEVQTEADLERWQTAVALAVRKMPSSAPEEIWDHADRTWRTLDDESMADGKALIARRNRSAAAKFRSQRRPAL